MLRTTVILFAITILCTMATATDSTSRLERAIQRNLLRVALNEGSIRVSDDEVRAIFETQVEWAGRRFRTDKPNGKQVYNAQLNLSPRVGGIREPRNAGNERWSRTVQWSTDAPPNWAVTGQPWLHHHEVRVHEIMVAAHATVRSFMRGENYIDQCRGTPFTWYGPRIDADAYEARNDSRAERGAPPLLHLPCGRTANLFVGKPAGGWRYPARRLFETVTIRSKPSDG